MEKENKMGTMPVGKLLISMALPMMISMLVQALYNIVDSVFVSRVSEDALTAVSMAFPMQNLMIATSVGIGVGINSVLSRKLGQKDSAGADAAANNGIFLEVIGFLLFLIIGAFVSRPFFMAQTDRADIIDMGVSYIKIVSMCSFGLFGQVTFERLLQSTGKTVYAMITQIIGALINIVLDPIMIFGLFGMPAMGVAGAAVATVIGQCCAAVVAVIFNLKKNTEINLFKKNTKINKIYIVNILSVGIPSIIMSSIGSVMTFCLNKILIAFSSTAVAVFGVYFKLQSFAFMPVFGLNNGMVPIVAFNYGARNRKRIISTIKLAICYAVAIMLVCTLIMQIFPDQLLMFFDASDHMLDIGRTALRIISIHFAMAGVSIVLSSVFQALGRGVLSMIVSIIRQLVFLVPCAFILAKVGGTVHHVWWSFPIAECASILICIIFFKMTYDKYLKNLE